MSEITMHHACRELWLPIDQIVDEPHIRQPESGDLISAEYDPRNSTVGFGTRRKAKSVLPSSRPDFFRRFGASERSTESIRIRELLAPLEEIYVGASPSDGYIGAIKRTLMSHEDRHHVDFRTISHGTLFDYLDMFEMRAYAVGTHCSGDNKVPFLLRSIGKLAPILPITRSKLADRVDCHYGTGVHMNLLSLLGLRNFSNLVINTTLDRLIQGKGYRGLDPASIAQNIDIETEKVLTFLRMLTMDDTWVKTAYHTMMAINEAATISSESLIEACELV